MQQNPLHDKDHKDKSKSSARFGLYTIILVGVLYLVVKAILYLTGSE